MTLLDVDRETRTRVMSIARLSGSHPDDDSDARDLTIAMNHLLVARRNIVEEGASDRAVKAFDRWVLARAGRQLVGVVWENPRLLRGDGPLLSDKYAYGAAWSPAALDLVLDSSGEDRPREAWVGNLEAEHVVPAGTIATILVAMMEKDVPVLDIKEMLRTVTVQVVVSKHATADRRDQPKARKLRTDAQQRLVRHFTRTDVLDEDALFDALWIRYLDPVLRDTLVWELRDLKTVDEERIRRQH